MILVTAAMVTVPSSILQVSYAQSNQDMQTVLNVHNQERGAVGVQPLTWSDQLAADAQTWAEEVATSGNFDHDPVNTGPSCTGLNATVRTLQASIRQLDQPPQGREWIYGRPKSLVMTAKPILVHLSRPRYRAVITHRWSGRTRTWSVVGSPVVMFFHTAFWSVATTRRATCKGRRRFGPGAAQAPPADQPIADEGAGSPPADQPVADEAGRRRWRRRR